MVSSLYLHGLYTFSIPGTFWDFSKSSQKFGFLLQNSDFLGEPPNMHCILMFWGETSVFGLFGGGNWHLFLEKAPKLFPILLIMGDSWGKVQKISRFYVKTYIHEFTLVLYTLGFKKGVDVKKSTYTSLPYGFIYSWPF